MINSCSAISKANSCHRTKLDMDILPSVERDYGSAYIDYLAIDLVEWSLDPFIYSILPYFKEI